MLLLDEVFAVGDENFQRKCFGVHRGVQAARRHDPLRLPRRRQAVERLCERVDPALGRREGPYDGPTHEAIARYRRTARRRARSRPSAAPGCASGAPARPRSPRLACSTPAASEREQFLAGEPLRLEVELEAREPVDAAAAPARAARRRPACSSPRTSSRHDDARLARLRARLDGDARRRAVAPARVRPLPICGSGSSARRAAAAPGSTTRSSFLVYPDGEERGLVHLGGTWRAGANQERR